MAAPSVSGGFTQIESCDTGVTGKSPIAPLSGSAVTKSYLLSNGYSQGLFGTSGCGRVANQTDFANYNKVQGGTYALASTEDFSTANKFLFVHLRTTWTTGRNTENLVSAAVSGHQVFVNSNSTGTEEAIYPVGGKDTPALMETGYNGIIIDLNRSTNAQLYSGTFDPANVTHIGLAHRPTGTYQDIYFDAIGYMEPVLMVNGEIGDKGNFAVISAAINAQNCIGSISPSESIHLLSYPFAIGDGATETHFEESIKTFEFAKDFTVAGKWGKAHLSDNSLGYQTNASINDIVSYVLCSWLSDTPFYWNSIGSTSATVSYTTCTIKGAGDLTIVDGHTFDGCTFDSCAEIATSQPTFTGCSFKNAAGVALTVDSTNGDANMTNVTFSGNQTAIKVDVAGNCDLDVAEFTFDSSNTYYIEYTGTGTLTVSSPSAIASGKLNASGGGTINVVAPTIQLEVTSNVAASDIKIFNAGTQTIEASGTGTSVTTQNTGTYDITVMKAGYLPQRQTGVVLGTSNVTVSINLVEDPIYNASHGLTWAATTSPTAGQVHWARAARRGYLSDNQQGRDVYSALIDFWIAQSALDNTEFPITAVGPDRFEFTSDGTTAAQLDSGSVTYWKGAGMTWEHATTGNDTHRYCSVKSVGTIGGTVKVRYVQEEGGTVNSVTLVSGVVDQVIQYYSDTNGDGTPDYNYDSHLVFKTFATDYYQARANILSSFGISALEPYEYIFVLENTATGTASGDQTFTPVVTNQQGAPVEEQTGYTFSFKVTEASNSKSPEAFLAQWLYDTYTDPTTANLYGSSLRAFDLPCPIVESGGSYSSIAQFVENTEDTTEKHGFYFEENAAYHPDFIQQQEDQDSGSGYFITPVTAQISITNLPDDVGGDSRLHIYNVTTDTVIYTGDPLGTGYTDTYTDGDAAYATAGDSIRIRYAHLNAATSFEYGQTIVAATTGGIVADGDNFVSADSVYALNAIDGSGITNFSADYVEDEIEIASDTDFTAAQAYAFYCFTLTDATGIVDFWGGVTATDVGNYRINNATVNMYFNSPTGVTYTVKQTDAARIYRADDAYPVKDPTTSGYGVQINWKNVVYVQNVGGSALTAGEQAQLSQAAQASTVNTKIGTPSVTVSDDIAAISAGGDATQAKQDTIIANLATVDSIVDSILIDTGTTIPAQISGLTAPDNASITAIKAKTDQLTFTKANELDSNIQSVNDVTVNGTGDEGSEWGP